MSATILSPTETRLIELCASRNDGPPTWTMDSRQRCDRVRAAITNSGLALPSGAIEIGCSYDLYDTIDLPSALVVLLADPGHKHLRRSGWIAWGGLRLDGSTVPAEEESFVNDLPAVPCVGRVWAPEERVPDPGEEAVMSLVAVTDLQQAWEVIVFFASIEEVIMDDRRRIDPRSFL